MQVLFTFAELVQSLNHAGDLESLARAVDVAIRVRRFGYHGTRDQVLEQFDGMEQVQQWLQRTPATIHFELEAATLQVIGPDQYSIRYRLTGPDDFVGGGLWQAVVGSGGKLQTLDHRPDDLDPKYGAAVLESGHRGHAH